MTKVICFGPGPKFKGGIADYNTALAKAFYDQQCQVEIVSWSAQYPSIIPRDFIDSTSKTDFLEGYNIPIHYITNYNNPFTWGSTAKLIASKKPDVVVFQWAIAIQGLPMGYIVGQLKKLLPKCAIFFDLHMVVQKEASRIDHFFSRYALNKVERYIVHAQKTQRELQQLLPKHSYSAQKSIQSKQVVSLYHPIYSLFAPDPNFDVQAFKQEHHLRKHVFLFFGFIRKYKGLHHCIDAFAELAKKREDVSLLICGESFWNTLDQKKWTTRLKSFIFGSLRKALVNSKTDESNYAPLEKLDKLKLGDRVVVFNKFIPNEEVHRYFQSADAVLLFYEDATPSGIESISYNFKKPLLATEVGHFKETITDGFNGYLAKAEDLTDMVRIMEQYLDHPLNPDHVEEKTKHMSWSNYAKSILDAAK